MKTTPGNSTDFNFIKAEYFRLSKKFRIQKVAIDKWLGEPFAQMLQNDGYPLDKISLFPQTYSNFAAPMKMLVESVVNHKIRHGGNPVLRWMAANVAAQIDPSGNMRPHKGESGGKIDGIVAGLMGLGECLIAPKPGSIYDTRGILNLDMVPCEKCKQTHLPGACQIS